MYQCRTWIGAHLYNMTGQLCGSFVKEETLILGNNCNLFLFNQSLVAVLSVVHIICVLVTFLVTLQCKVGSSMRMVDRPLPMYPYGFGFCCPMPGRWQCSAAASWARCCRCVACSSKNSREMQRKNGAERACEVLYDGGKCTSLPFQLTSSSRNRCYASECLANRMADLKLLCLFLFPFSFHCWMTMVLHGYALGGFITFTCLSLSASQKH